MLILAEFQHFIDRDSAKVLKTDEGLEFRTFLHLLEKELPLGESSHLAEEEMAKRFYYASDGVIAYVMKLIRYGAYLALGQNREKLDFDILGAAFAKYVQADKPDKVNPFLTDNFQPLKSFHSPAGLTVGATNNRLKPKSNSLKASSVLKSK